MPFIMIGCLLNSALFLTCVFVTGLVTGHVVARDLAIAAMGVTYLSYMAQLRPGQTDNISIVAVALSVVLGAASGLALLF